MNFEGKRVSVYYEKLNQEHRTRGLLASPMHVAKENGYLSLIKRDERLVQIPWERIIRVEEDD